MSPRAAAITDQLIDQAAHMQAAGEAREEKRAQERHPYDAPAAIVLLSHEGQFSRPIPVRTADISHGGMRVVSRNMIHPGAHGAVQLLRSNGQVAVVGVRVMHCRYAGEMQHHTGLKFEPLSAKFTADRFLDAHGNPLIAPQPTKKAM